MKRASKRCKRHNCNCKGCGRDLSKEDEVFCVKFNGKWIASYCKKCYEKIHKPHDDEW